MNSSDALKNQESSGLKSSLALSIPAAILAVALALGLNQVGNGFASRSETGISVTGSARVNATADNAVWTLNVNATSPSLAAAVKSVNDDMNELVSYLEKGGFSRDVIQLGALATFGNEEWINGNSTGRILSYRADRPVTIRSTDVELVASMSNGIGALLERGVKINNYGPNYYISSLKELRPELLKEAMLDAETRAKAIVESTGGKVGAAIAVRSGPFQVTSPDSVDTSAGGYYDTSTIEKTVTATVTATFKTD
jgi:hypothetical protein